MAQNELMEVSEKMCWSKCKNTRCDTDALTQIIRRQLFALFTSLVFITSALAAEQTYVREYVYQASEADSKLSARTIALQEVRRLLLAELGTHVSSLVMQQTSSDGKQLGTEQIETLSAGVTRVEILEEKWNGVEYVLKAQIKADPADVLKSLHKMLDADKKNKQLSQLDSELGKVRSENIQMGESLTQSKKEATAALAEISRLKKQLELKQTEVEKKSLQAAYQQQVDELTLNELFDSGWQLYSKGNLQEAHKIWKKAAEQGFPQAQNNLGVMYDQGRGVARDPKQAVYWFQKAAEQGEAKSQDNLGVMYSQGKGVAHDAKQAMYWFQKAAEQGYSSAQFNLGVMYNQGEGVARDAKQALYWSQKAAEQGVAQAQTNLGMMYSRGEGVARDAKQAMYWYQKAAEQGDENAVKALRILGK